MKTKFLTIATAILCCVFFASCDKEKDPVNPDNPENPEKPEDPDKPDKPAVPETTFSFELNLEENNLNVKVISSGTEAEYISGIIDETQFQEIGGAEGLMKFADAQLQENPEIHKGNFEKKYEKINWFTNYYAYAVQITLDGEKYVAHTTTAVSEASKAVRHYIEFNAEQDCAPMAISDNGRYVVGQSMESSYIYDIYTDKLEYISGAMLYDISDNGVAYGTNTVFQAVKYENGEIIPIALPEGALEACLFSVSPDGKKAVGYMADENYYFQPLVIDNMSASFLEKGKGPDDLEVAACVCRAIGSNGMIAGYSITADWNEMSCYWDANGKFQMFGVQDMKDSFNAETGYYDLIIGNMFTMMSPNGKYIASNYVQADPNDVWTTYMYPYLYNTETKELTYVDASVCSDFDYTRVDAVSSSGMVFIGDVDMGFSSAPYVWTKETNKITLLQEYLAGKGMNVEKDMVGSVVGTSADEKTLLLGNLPTDNDVYVGYTTIIYIF